MSNFKSSAFDAGSLDLRQLITELTTKLACRLENDQDASNRSSTDTSTNIDHDYTVTLEADEVCYAFFQANFSQNNGGAGFAQIDLSAELDAVDVSPTEVSPQLTQFVYQTVSDTDTGRGVYSKVLSLFVEGVEGDVTFLARFSNQSSGDAVYVWFSEWVFLIGKRRKFHDRLSS